MHSKFSVKDKNMIHSFNVKLINQGNKKIPYNFGYQMYGVLMEMLDNNICEMLHENSITALSQSFVFNNKNETAEWTLNCFNEEIANAISNVFVPDREFHVSKENITFKSQDISDKCINGLRDLMTESSQLFGDERNIKLNFQTATAFKQNGKFIAYPSVELIIKNLVNKFNFLNSDSIIDDEYVLEQLFSRITLAEFNLRSSYYHLKGMKLLGFIGDITLSSRLAEPIMELFRLLLYFSNYSGVGIKTTLGMGRTLTFPKSSANV